MEKKKVVILCAAVAVTACFVTGMFMYFFLSSQERGNEIRVGSGNYDDITKYMEISDLEKVIKDYYYKDVEEDNLVTGALKGMVNSLGDPYSVYYTEEEYSEYNANSEGTFVGVGVAVAPVSKESGHLKVVNVYSGGPAETAGIVEGDVITAVDGVDIGEMDYEGAKDLISGPSGSNVTLTMETSGVARDVSTVRAQVKTPFVFYSMLDDEIGYIVISEFHGDCVEEFKTSLQKLKEEEGAKGVVIDLRGNMGGTVGDAIDILDQIMPEGLLSYRIDKNGERSDFKADADYDPIPFSVLVNGGTASASEIFSAAIQDNGRAPIVGTQTYGKGVAQAILNMPYSGGGIKLTTATYYTPKGSEINGVGITPGVVVDMPQDQTGMTQDTDPQLQAGKEAVRTAIGES